MIRIGELREDLRRRWTLGRLMLLIALVAVTLAWYVQRVGEIARQQAVADAERDLYLSHANQLLELMEEQDRREQEHWAREIARAKSPTQAPVASIPQQVGKIVKLLDERAKLEAKSVRSRMEVAEKIRARMEKKRLEAGAAGPAPSPTQEQPR